MSTMTKDRKSERLVARVTKTDKQLFERAALLEGRSVATFVVAHALKAAERLIQQQQVIRLNADQSRRFVEALLTPRQQTSRMKRAVNLYRKSVTEV